MMILQGTQDIQDTQTTQTTQVLQGNQEPQGARITSGGGRTRSKFGIIGLVMILLLTILSRTIYLAADPPDWLQGAFITDEGWWADAARGKIFFNNYFSDDFGTAYLVTPAYTLALEAIYSIWGVGLAQTRALEALSSVLIVMLIAGLLWRRRGPGEAIFAAALLGLSPFFWVYGRIALQETYQALFITLSFIFMLSGKESKWAATGCGLALAIAIAVKPNAITLGAFPLGLTALVIGLHSHVHTDPENWPDARRRLITHAGFALAGFSLGLAVLLFAIAIPNWDAFWPMLYAEGGMEEAGWKYRVRLPGIWLISTIVRESEHWPIHWAVARRSPAIGILAWLCFVNLAIGLRGGFMTLLRSLSVLEAAATAWTLGTFIAIGTAFYQPDRRYVLLMPGLAILASLFLARCLARRCSFQQGIPRPPRFKSLYFMLFWFVLLLPVMILIKPWVSGLLMILLQDIHVTKNPGIDYSTAATLFMGCWLLLFPILARFPIRADRLGQGLLRRKVIIPLTACLMLYEAGVITLYFAHATHNASGSTGRAGEVCRRRRDRAGARGDNDLDVAEGADGAPGLAL